MIFAHGPLGSIIARSTWRSFDAFNFTRKQKHFLLLIGFIGGIIPDIDLFYTSFINGSTPHRALITHTLVPYVIIFAVSAIVALLIRKHFLLASAVVFFLGNASHMVFDMIASSIRLFFPFNETFIGLSLVQNPQLHDNLLFINFLTEIILFGLFCIVMIREYVSLRYQQVWGIVVGLLTAAIILVLVVWNNHIYKSPDLSYFEDIDGDGIVNFQDFDMDGDGVENIDDTDSDGDTIDNPIEAFIASRAFDHVWIDPVSGGFAAIPQRMGFVSENDIAWRVYKSLGIIISEEILRDARVHSSVYYNVPLPKADQKIIDPKALQVWLSHIGRLDSVVEIQTYPTRIGDLLFTTKGRVYLVSGMNDANEPVVVNAKKQESYGGKVQLESLDVVLEREKDTIQYRGRVLYPTQETGDSVNDVSLLIQ